MKICCSQNHVLDCIDCGYCEIKTEFIKKYIKNHKGKYDEKFKEKTEYELDHYFDEKLKKHQP